MKRLVRNGLLMASLAAVLFTGTVAAEAHPSERATTNGRAIWAEAQTGQRRPPCIRRSWIPQNGMPTAEKQWRVIRLVDCATRRWWPGRAREVLEVLWRESRYDPFATNPRDGVACWAETYGSCGLGQHLIRYWPGRLFYLQPEWFRQWPARWYNARANVIVTVRMMAAQGGVCPAWC